VHYVGLFFLALVTFVFALQATFPYDRVKSKLEELAGSKYDVSIREIDRGIMPGRFYLKDVTLKTRPTAAEVEKVNSIADVKERDKAMAQLVTTIYVEKLEIDIGLLGFIRGTASLNFNAKFGDGSIAGKIAVSKGATSLHIVGNEVPSQQLPMREVLSNLPMSGKVDFEFDLELPNEKLKSGKFGPNWVNAIGGAEFSCPSGCTIGDGKAKLKLKAKNSRSQAFAGEGTDFGTLKIDSLVAKVEIKDGKVDITKFETKSSDVELMVDYTMTLGQDINESVVMGCLRFKGTEALKKREPKTFDQILLTGAARHSDGLDHIRLKGSFKDMKKLPEVCGPGITGISTDNVGGGTPSRPNLTVQPDEPVPTDARTMPIPQINPPPPAPIDAGAVQSDAAVFVPVPGPGSEHQLPSTGDRSGAGSDGHGSDVGPGSGTAGAGHER